MEVSGGFANTPRQQLRTLLDSVVVAARQDVHDYCGGHLNEANLYKHPEFANHKPWSSSKKGFIPSNPPSKIPHVEKNAAHMDAMKGTMVNFSLGTLGNIPLPPLKTRGPPRYSPESGVKKEQDSPQTTPRSKTRSRASKKTGRSSGTLEYSDDGVQVEELKLPEVMLLRTSHRQMVHMGRGRTPIDVTMHHEFLAGHLEAVTKKDQFNRLKVFENEVIGKNDASERNVMMGMRSVDHLEAKLKEELRDLDEDMFEPNFHRLQVYSGVFEDLINESQTFGFVLRRVKREYDTYMAGLLDEPTGLNGVLQEQVAQLASHPSSNPALLSMEQSRLHSLEKRASEALDENERLRRAVREEMNRPLEPEPEPVTDTTPATDPTTEMDIVETVESLKSNLLEKLDALHALRATLRKNYVPSTVCTHLEQCIKETEPQSINSSQYLMAKSSKRSSEPQVEIQRLMSSKNYFEGNIMEMEKDLQDAIENADTTERDQRRVWKRVSAVKAGESNKNEQDSDYEQDESSKWNWYIS